MTSKTRMNEAEFVMWILGFVETVRGRPTREQWAKFVDRHAEVVGARMRDMLSSREAYRDLLDKQMGQPHDSTGGWIPLPSTITVSGGTATDMYKTIGSTSTFAAPTTGGTSATSLKLFVDKDKKAA